MDLRGHGHYHFFPGQAWARPGQAWGSMAQSWDEKFPGLLRDGRRTVDMCLNGQYEQPTAENPSEFMFRVAQEYWDLNSTFRSCEHW